MTALALIDVDGTLTSARSLWPAMHAAANTTTPAERHRNQYANSQLSYIEYADRDASLLHGMTYGALENACHSEYRPGIDELFTTLTARGFDIVLVSSGVQFLPRQLKRTYGDAIADMHHNHLTFDANARCTGRISIAVDDTSKHCLAERIVATTQPEFVVAIGDSTADHGLYAVADISVSLGDHPSPHRFAQHHAVTAPSPLHDVAALIASTPNRKERHHVGGR